MKSRTHEHLIGEINQHLGKLEDDRNGFPEAKWLVQWRVDRLERERSFLEHFPDHESENLDCN